jgi:hypothetical protein
MYPQLVPSAKVFVCPGTKNNVRADVWSLDPYSGQNVLKDLLNNATGGAQGTNGHSYEIIGAVRGTKVSEAFYGNYVEQANELFLGSKPGASRFWLFYDSDDAGVNNVWDEPDNHGVKGGNVTYGDCHANWVKNWKPHNDEFRITLDYAKSAHTFRSD